MTPASDQAETARLQAQVDELTRQNKLLRESVSQGNRIQKMWQDSVAELKKTKKALKRSEERFQLAVDGSRDGVWDWDLVNNLAYYSPRWKAMLGYDDNEIGADINETLDRIHPEDAHEMRISIDAYLAGEIERFEVMTRMRSRSGDYRWILTRGKALWDRSGKALRFVGTSADLTERMEVEQQLKLGARVMESTHEGVVVTDRDATIEAVNPAFTALTGYPPEDVVGRNPSLLSSGRHPPEFYREMWQTLEQQGGWKGEIWNRRRDGQLFAEALRISAIRDSRGEVTHYVGILSDITKEKEQQERLHHMAFHDALTGLPNRIVFNDRLGQALRQAKRHDEKVAVLFFDLDRFKAVNDTFGHKIGDLLLQGVTERVRACLREEDTIARIGGDEFCAVVRGSEKVKEIGEVGQRIIARLNQPFDIEGHRCEIGCSIGISRYPADSQDQSQLIKFADEAMYRAKAGGRNRLIFHDGGEGNSQQADAKHA
jgi:diguanylate cyclase (GGDEF)-like protein/PAS domain S-box-containing protein